MCADGNIYPLLIGVAVQSPIGPQIARAILIMGSFDLPARAIVMNTKQWNGQYGCLYCEDKGTTVGSDHLHRYWPDEGPSVERTHTSLLKNAEDAASVVSIYILLWFGICYYGNRTKFIPWYMYIET